MSHAPLIAIDIGNSRIKFGLFTNQRHEAELPVPSHALELPITDFAPVSLDEWLSESDSAIAMTAGWWIASVNRGPTELLLTWLQKRGVRERSAAGTDRTGAAPGYRVLRQTDLPLMVNLPEPDKVGIDRLLGAVAANHLRAAGRPAIVIDLGSAMTVDLISVTGAFLGGAILPGIGMSARAMHNFTDRLPSIPMDELADPPPALGTATVAAMRSGLYWGAVGAMKELIARLSTTLPRDCEPPEIFLTGGAAAVVAQVVDPRAQYLPHLVLGGIALVARA